MIANNSKLIDSKYIDMSQSTPSSIRDSKANEEFSKKKKKEKELKCWKSLRPRAKAIKISSTGNCRAILPGPVKTP